MHEPQQRLLRALRSFDAGAFTTRHGGYKESTSERSHEYLLSCPYCGSDRLRWNHPAKQAWICWGCRKRGSSFDLVQLLEQLSWEDTYRFVIANDSGGGGDVRTLGTIARQRTARPVKAMLWPNGVDLLQPGYAPHARGERYLAARGITAEQMIEYQLGVGTRGWLRDYVLFPCYRDAALVYWQGRATWDPPYGVDRRAWAKETGYRKTLNPRSAAGYATAEDVVFGLDRVRGYSHVVICEGPVDALKVGPHACALLGKVASPAKVGLISRLPGVVRYTVYLDPDAGERAQSLARELSVYAPVHIAHAPAGRDAGDLTPYENAGIVAAAPRYSEDNLLESL